MHALCTSTSTARAEQAWHSNYKLAHVYICITSSLRSFVAARYIPSRVQRMCYMCMTILQAGSCSHGLHLCHAIMKTE